MQSQQRLDEIIAQYQSGALTRDEFWRAMQQRHLQLREYSQLVGDAQVERIEIDASEVRIVLRNGLKVRWNPEDVRTVPNIVLNHTEYERDELALLERLGGECSVILDIGANIGWYSLHLAHLLRDQPTQIYAFEPVPRTFAELTRNIALNGYGETIHAFNHALGESEGALRFYVPTFTGSVAASQRQLFPNESNEEVECAVVPLDVFTRQRRLERVDLIKCDVEGSELLVLRGGPETIQRFRPIIMLEMLRKWSEVFGYHPNDIITLLRGYGYRCWSYEAETFSELTQMDESCMQTNFFFLHTDRHQDLLAEIAAGTALVRAGA